MDYQNGPQMGWFGYKGVSGDYGHQRCKIAAILPFLGDWSILPPHVVYCKHRFGIVVKVMPCWSAARACFAMCCPSCLKSRGCTTDCLRMPGSAWYKTHGFFSGNPSEASINVRCQHDPPSNTSPRPAGSGAGAFAARTTNSANHEPRQRHRTKPILPSDLGPCSDSNSGTASNYAARAYA